MVLAYAFTVIGLWLLWRATWQTNLRPWTGALVGAMLVGWGIFNLAEGIIDHHILGIHHVRPGPNQLAWGAAMLAGGWWLTTLDKSSRQVQVERKGSDVFAESQHEPAPPRR